MSDFDLSVTDELLMTTKQVRKRLDFDRAVPREILLDCIELASRAPQGGNHERNKWLIIEEPELKARVGAAYLEHAIPYLEESASQSTDDRGGRVASSAHYLATRMHEVPAMVMPLRLDRVQQLPPPAQAAWWGSVLPGVWSFQLALRSRGLGSCWTTLHLGAESEVGELLGIPESVTQCALLPVGYYTGESFTAAPRRSAHDITFIDTYGNKAK